MQKENFCSLSTLLFAKGQTFMILKCMTFYTGASLALLTLGLAGCNDVIRAQPYLVGTFKGTYELYDLSRSEPENPPSFPIVIESQLVSTAASRYTFEGTVDLDDVRYTMTGYEENRYGDIVYLQPQARGIGGDFVMTLQDETGSSLSICGSTYYGLVGSEQLPRLYGQLVAEGVTSADQCYANATVLGAFGDLQKQP